MKEALIAAIVLVCSTGYSQGPVVLSFDPKQGVIGSTVCIKGANFSSTPEDNVVYFGASRASVIEATKEELLVTVPPGANYKPISVLVNGLIAHSKTPFTVKFENKGVYFAYPSVYSTFPTKPIDIALGDFDGDLKVDLAAVGFNNDILNKSGEVLVFQNITENLDSVTFKEKSVYETGINPHSVKIFDMDGDGGLDIIVLNSTSASISILRNSSSGQGVIDFEAKQDFETGLFPVHFTIADLDSDGKLDIAVSNSIDFSFSVLKNISTPGKIDFKENGNCKFLTQLGDIEAGDLDGDGFPELIISVGLKRALWIFKNRSMMIDSIAFDEPFELLIDGGGGWLTLGDVDYDSKLDVILSIPTLVTNLAGESFSHVFLFKNTSKIDDFSFEKYIYKTAVFAREAAISDFDGDGGLDFAVGASALRDSLSIFRNKNISNQIEFSKVAAYRTGANPLSIEAGDMNGDGRTDLVIGARGGGFMIHKNFAKPPPLGASQFEQIRIYPNPSSSVLNIEGGAHIASLKIMNLLGQVVAKYTNNETIDVTNLSVGTYFLIIDTWQGGTKVVKFIKK